MWFFFEKINEKHKNKFSCEPFLLYQPLTILPTFLEILILGLGWARWDESLAWCRGFVVGQIPGL